MFDLKGLRKQLRELLAILKDEKEALIKNDSPVVASLIERKIEIVSSLEELKKDDAKIDEETIKLIEEIKDLQETNLLLTKQALKFQEKLIETIAKNINAVADTYSQKGEYNKQTQDINLVDHKV